MLIVITVLRVKADSNVWHSLSPHYGHWQNVLVEVYEFEWFAGGVLTSENTAWEKDDS